MSEGRKMSDTDKGPTPAIVLVRPQMGENIGAAARAMLNFGMTGLRIVNPRDGWPSDAAQATAAGALDTLSGQIGVFDTLPDALHDIQYAYATTARADRDINKPAALLDDAARACVNKSAQSVTTAFVFGAERTGLTNEELSCCHEIVHVPTNPDFSSLNLGQAVLLAAYALRLHMEFGTAGTDNAPPIKDAPENAPAPLAMQHALLSRLEQELAEHRFFKTQEMQPAVTRNIRSMILRAGWSEQEISTFHGMITALISQKTEK
jgi:tRNA/rRNA methyltransferase